MSALSEALARVRARRGRALLAALGIAAAATMLGTGVTVSLGLATGFERSATEADLPAVIARFDPEPRARVDERLRGLANIESRAYRTEFTDVPLSSGAQSTSKGAVHVVERGRRGYAIVAGRELSGRPDEVVIEQGLASDWGIGPGASVKLGRLGLQRVVGVAVAPDNVAFPLASTARVYVSDAGLARRFGEGVPEVNTLLLWTRDPARLDETLTQARVASFGVTNLRFLTRAGVQATVGQAAGIVISLLVAFSLVALAAAAAILAFSAHADVQRRLAAIGVERALGFGRGRIAARYALEGALLAVPAGALGLALGALVAAAPMARVLAALNQLPPGAALLGPLAACLAALVGLVAAASAWPAWRAARRPPAETLRGADVHPPGWGRALSGGFLMLGARLVAARRARAAGVIAVLAISAGVVLLMLSLASLLDRLQDDPTVLGKRYQLEARVPASAAADVRRLPGVAAASPRYAVDAADSFSLGETLRVIAYPGDHRRFEAPPLAEGRRARGADEAEIGVGLSRALGVRPGGTLAVQLPGGGEARFRVSGLVQALERDGRVAYVRSRRLLAAGASPDPTVVVRLRPGADRAAVARGLAALGAKLQPVGAATTRNGAFLGALAALLRAVALVNGAICLYALVQALALTARERRSTVAVLRSAGAGRRSVALLFAGAAASVAVPAALAGLLLERLVLAPVAGRLAAGYASLPLGAGGADIAAVLAGLITVAALAAAWVARRIERQPVVSGLRGD